MGSGDLTKLTLPLWAQEVREVKKEIKAQLGPGQETGSTSLVSQILFIGCQQLGIMKVIVGY